jgi:hypothetical protein
MGSNSVGSYVNYVESGIPAERYFGGNLDRLTGIRRKYDPDRLMFSGVAFEFWPGIAVTHSRCLQNYPIWVCSNRFQWSLAGGHFSSAGAGVCDVKAYVRDAASHR